MSPTLDSCSRTTRQAEKKARKAKSRQQKELAETVESIVQANAANTAKIAVALAVKRAYLTEEEHKDWQQDMEQRMEKILQHPEQNLGCIEEELARAARQPLRLMAERAAQAKANATPCLCPTCKTQLEHVRVLGRGIDSRFGRLQIFRAYGRCEPCGVWRFPADLVLGLNKNSPASPYLQEVTALLNTKMPSGQAVDVAARFGLELSRCFIHREAHRQGLKAEQVRAAGLAEFDTWEGIQKSASHHEGSSSAPFTLIIEIDAWNIRERDDWGRTEEARQEALLQNKDKPSKWHWVYVATVFRLDHRGKKDGGRPFISQRGYVSTRLGTDALMRQLHKEAIDRGLGQAQDVLVIADGAVWIWNIAEDRFSEARCRLDLYHSREHLWTVANDLFGKDSPEGRQWVQPLLEQLHQDQPLALIQSLKDVQALVNEKLQKKVQTQITYFENNRNRLNYREILEARKAVKEGIATQAQSIKAAEPLGSGAIESTCRQYQCRFKRTGQFWSTEGDEALMCLETFWRNARWHLLFPHAKPPSLANN